MGRESRSLRSARCAAITLSLSLGTGCLLLLAQSAADWAALARRYSEAAKRGGTCPAGAPHAEDARDAAGRAEDAAARAQEGHGLEFAANAARIDAYDAEIAAKDAEIAAERAAAAAAEYASIGGPVARAASEAAAEVAAAAAERASAAAAIAESSKQRYENQTRRNSPGDPQVLARVRQLADSMREPLAALKGLDGVDLDDDGTTGSSAGAISTVDGQNAARSYLDTALGMLEAAELELLRMRSAQLPNDNLEAVKELRRSVPQADTPNDLRLLGQLIEDRMGNLLFRVEEEEKIIADWGNTGIAVHEGEETAREEAEATRVAAEAALSACGVASEFNWDYDDPLTPAYDQDLSNQDDYVPPSTPGP